MKIFKLLRKIFSNDTDREVAQIVDPVRKQFKKTALTAKEQRDLLRKNGVGLQVVVATGGIEHHE